MIDRRSYAHNSFKPTVDLITQLVEHCTGIAEVMGSNPVQAWICFQVLISQLLKLCVYKCYNVFIRVFSVVTL